MFYVEWLRVRNCLRILAIVLAALFVVAVIARIAVGMSPHVQIQSGDEAITARALLAFAAFVAVIIATVLAAPLAKENSNHLEVVWTKPVSRTVMALGMFGVDTIGILISMVFAVIFIIAAGSLFVRPHIVIDQPTLPVLALCVLAPIAWYDLLTAASASMKRGYGAVLGLGWFLALIVPGLAIGLTQVESPIFHLLGVVLSVLTFLDPIAYMHLSTDLSPGNGQPSVGFMFGIFSAPAGVRAAILLVLSILYSTLALLQWRRLEA